MYRGQKGWNVEKERMFNISRGGQEIPCRPTDATQGYSSKVKYYIKEIPLEQLELSMKEFIDNHIIPHNISLKMAEDWAMSELRSGSGLTVISKGMVFKIPAISVVEYFKDKQNGGGKAEEPEMIEAVAPIRRRPGRPKKSAI